MKRFILLYIFVAVVGLITSFIPLVQVFSFVGQIKQFIFWPWNPLYQCSGEGCMGMVFIGPLITLFVTLEVCFLVLVWGILSKKIGSRLATLFVLAIILVFSVGFGLDYYQNGGCSKLLSSFDEDLVRKSGSCSIQQAYKNNNLKWCENGALSSIWGQSDRPNYYLGHCYGEIANNLNDPKICERLSNELSRVGCRLRAEKNYYKYRNSIGDCANVSDPEDKNVCLYWVIRMSDVTTYNDCQMLSSEGYFRNDCLGDKESKKQY